MTDTKKNRMTKEEYLQKCEEVEDTAYAEKAIHRVLETIYYSKTLMPSVKRLQN